MTAGSDETADRDCASCTDCDGAVIGALNSMGAPVDRCAMSGAPANGLTVTDGSSSVDASPPRGGSALAADAGGAGTPAVGGRTPTPGSTPAVPNSPPEAVVDGPAGEPADAEEAATPDGDAGRCTDGASAGGEIAVGNADRCTDGASAGGEIAGCRTAGEGGAASGATGGGTALVGAEGSERGATSVATAGVEAAVRPAGG